MKSIRQSGKFIKKGYLYKAWKSMMYRCYDKKNSMFKHYGGRGISVCNQWFDFDVFVKDMGHRPSKKHSIDRINNNGNYEPSNCRWATEIEQKNNMRTNRRFTLWGKTKTMAEWARVAGIKQKTFFMRISKGWDIERAVTAPLGPQGLKSRPSGPG
jgi:hypothetical protein